MGHWCSTLKATWVPNVYIQERWYIYIYYIIYVWFPFIIICAVRDLLYYDFILLQKKFRDALLDTAMRFLLSSFAFASSSLVSRLDLSSGVSSLSFLSFFFFFAFSFDDSDELDLFFPFFPFDFFLLVLFFAFFFFFFAFFS